MKRSTFIKICLGASALSLVGGNINEILQSPKIGKFTKVVTIHFPEGKDFSSYWNDRNQWLNSQAAHDFTSKNMKDHTITNFKKVVGTNRVEFHYSFNTAEAGDKFLEELKKFSSCKHDIRENLGYKVTLNSVA